MLEDGDDPRSCLKLLLAPAVAAADAPSSPTAPSAAAAAAADPAPLDDASSSALLLPSPLEPAPGLRDLGPPVFLMLAMVKLTSSRN